MTEEKKIIIQRIDELINKRRDELMKGLPSVHEVSDGVIIRFFTEWDMCSNDIKYRRIASNDNTNENMLFFYIPRGTVLKKKKRDYITSITCISGLVEIVDADTTHLVRPYMKISVGDMIEGVALADSYVITNNI